MIWLEKFGAVIQELVEKKASQTVVRAFFWVSTLVIVEDTLDKAFDITW